MTSTISNPGTWSVGKVRSAGRHMSGMLRAIGNGSADTDALPRIRRLEMEDLRIALRKGFDDFSACRSDVVFICLLYPIIGIFLAWAAFQRELLPLLFPVMSGFALVGPVAAVGLYEMSRRRERNETASLAEALRVVGSPSFGAILALGLLLFATFLVWLILADQIYTAALGPEAPASIGAFLINLFTTVGGWTMMIVGFAVGAVFAAAVLAISVVSFPLLLDRNYGLPLAVVTSIQVTRKNPRIIAIWGAIVAASLAIGSVPAFLGLVVVMPVLGHATWHLYRRAVGFEPAELTPSDLH